MDIDQLITRVAQLETELSSFKSKPKGPAFNQAEFTRQMTLDPIGTMRRMGVPQTTIDHVGRASFVAALGDQATPEQRALVGMGPQIDTTNQLASSIEALSRRLDEQDQRAVKATTRTSMKTLIESEAKKYPHLAKAFVADPSLFDSDVDNHKGDVAALAIALEAKEAKRAAAYGVKLESQSASDGKAETKQDDDQSKKIEPAPGDTIDVPALPKKAHPGEFTPDEDAKLRAEILGKYTTPSQ